MEEGSTCTMKMMKTKVSLFHQELYVFVVFEILVVSKL